MRKRISVGPAKNFAAALFIIGLLITMCIIIVNIAGDGQTVTVTGEAAGSALIGGGSPEPESGGETTPGYINDKDGGEDSPELKSLYGKIVYLDPGHGGEDDGATRNGIKEKDINLAIVKLVIEELAENAPDIHVVMSREGDERIDALDRAERANRCADLLVSVHCNAYGERGEDNEVTGTEVHYNPGQLMDENRRTSLTGEELAEIMLNNVCGEAGSKNRGLFDNTGLKITTAATIPSVLIETGFMSNAQEREKLNSHEYRLMLAKGISRGIIEAFNTR